MTIWHYLVQIGFLYLRYVADPKILWTWYEPYLRDDEVHGTFPSFLFLIACSCFCALKLVSK